MNKVKSPKWTSSSTAAYGKNSKDYRYPAPVLEDTDKHQLVSFIKSGLRILGLIIIPLSLSAGLTLLVIAEAIGIVEEMV